MSPCVVREDWPWSCLWPLGQVEPRHRNWWHGDSISPGKYVLRKLKSFHMDFFIHQILVIHFSQRSFWEWSALSHKHKRSDFDGLSIQNCTLHQALSPWEPTFKGIRQIQICKCKLLSEGIWPWEASIFDQGQVPERDWLIGWRQPTLQATGRVNVAVLQWGIVPPTSSKHAGKLVRN